MLGTSIIRKEALLCRREGLGLHGPGGDPPRDDGRVQLVQGQLEADGPPVAHRGHIPPFVDEGDRGVFPRSWDPGVHSAGVIDG